MIDNLLWSDLDVDDNGHVTVNELGRCLRQQGIQISNFAILRIASDGQVRKSKESNRYTDTL